MNFLNFSKANCKNCYKCLRNCPVKAIQIKNEQAHIIEDRCIGCGQCFMVCPQNAREIASDLEGLYNAISQNKKIIATIAPSFMGAFDISQGGQIVSGLKKLGFHHVEETAIGAELVTMDYKNYIKNNKKTNYITTCCPSSNYLIEKYYPSLIEYMMPIVSPMIAHGKYLRKEHGWDSYIVFLGPCTSKKIESIEYQHKGVIDAVITFEELEILFKKNNINLNDLEPMDFDKTAHKAGSSFPIGGGVLSSVIKDMIKDEYEVIAVDGINQCIELFESLEKGSIKNAIIEANVCIGSCIGGMAMPKNKENFYLRKNRVKNYIKSKKENGVNSEVFVLDDNINLKKWFVEDKINVQVSEKDIRKILRKMGKFTLEDELNCSGCGYNTCRQKAKAVVLGMAEINMCLPYMRSKAESLKNMIFENSPNAIFVVDEDMLIKEINPIVEKIFNVKASKVKEKGLAILLDDEDFRKVRDTKESIIGKKVSYYERDVVFIQNILYIEKQNVLLAIMIDITSEEKNRERLTEVKKQTLDAAQKVIEKQMRVAQEIASLLGETTAETKTTLTKLKKITVYEKGDLI